MAFSPRIQRTRAFQPTGIGYNQFIHDAKYATRSIPAGVIPSTVNFFTAAPSADPTSDRYEQGNTLVSSGKKFNIFSILVQVLPGAACVLGDLEKVINYCSVRLVTAQKEYGVFPLFMLPAGGGISIHSGQVAVTPAAAPGAQSVVGATNGVPSRDSCFSLAVPLEIQANQSFYMELLGPVAAGVFGAATLTGAVQVRLVLDGVEERVAA